MAGAAPPAGHREAPALPLDGIVVLDLTRALAGPYATALLADLGATIIKVESKKGGDSTRAWPPFEGPHSLYFDSVNRNKSSIAIDFYSPEGAALLRRMALDADVVIENFKPGTLAEMGLDPAGLRAEKPSLIVASVSGFGATGPLAQAAGLDQVAQGMSGLMSVTGDDAEHPTRVGVPIVDIYAGVFTAVGIAAALVGRERTGGAENGAGRQIETSLLEAAIAVSAFQGQRYLSTGEVPQPQGNNHPVLAPYGVFATADIPIIIAAGNDRHFQQLAELLGEPGLADEPEFATGRARSGHRQELTARLEQLLAARPGLEWVDELRRIGIPAGPILNYEQVFRDPQVRHLDMVTHLTRRDGSALPLLRGPITVDGIAPIVRKAPPELGEDTRAVLDRLGLTAEQIDGLLAAGIVTEPAD
ncbi:MAG TPA: CoA transferase [Pseudolysinimonas sp.]|nr:CoA transferase [Pseudolysinimonas sp.]